jgi:hypothetical protein
MTALANNLQLSIQSNTGLLFTIRKINKNHITGTSLFSINDNGKRTYAYKTKNEKKETRLKPSTSLSSQIYGAVEAFSTSVRCYIHVSRQLNVSAVFSRMKRNMDRNMGESNRHCGSSSNEIF